MSDDIRRLLAGYATGTLTDTERQALFTAALHDEELFAAISEEEPLRELLADPAARSELLARIQPAPVSFSERFAAWLRRPAVAAGFGTAAVAVVMISLVPLLRDQSTPRPAAVARAVLDSPAPLMTPAPELPKAAPKTAAQTVQRRAERAATPVTRPAPAPRQKEEERPAAAPAPGVADEPASEQQGKIARAIAPPAVRYSLQQPPPAPAASAEMAMLPRETIEVRTDVARQVAAPRPAGTPPRITVLRKNASGDYSEVDPSKTEFSAGETVRLRIEPGEGGLVRLQGATPQPIVQQLADGRAFETGDILLGTQDMRVVIQFSRGFPVVRTLVNSQASYESAQANAGQPQEIILRIKKP